MANVGEQLLQPEAGWRRYDDTNSLIKYESGWGYAYDSYCYNNSRHSTTQLNGKLSFRFYGTKLRLICAISAGESSNVEVFIDGVSYTFSLYNPATIRQILVFEKLDLQAGSHTVELFNRTTGYVSFDAIDIDETGVLLGDTFYLIEDQGVTYSYDGTAFIPIASQTEQDFKDSLLHPSMLLQGEPQEIFSFTNPKILVWTPSTASFNIEYSTVPEGEIIKSKNDLPLIDVQRVVKLTLSPVIDNVLVVYSVDGGITWKGKLELSELNPAEIKSKGLTIEEYNQVDFSILQAPFTIRNSFFIEKDGFIDKLEGNFIMNGSFEKINSTMVNLKLNQNNLDVTYLVDGTYIFNILKGV